MTRAARRGAGIPLVSRGARCGCLSCLQLFPETTIVFAESCVFFATARKASLSLDAPFTFEGASLFGFQRSVAGVAFWLAKDPLSAGEMSGDGVGVKVPGEVVKVAFAPPAVSIVDGDAGGRMRRPCALTSAGAGAV